MTEGARVVVVTGASSGIGRAVALQSAAAGDHVVLVARGEPPLQQVAQECDTSGAASTLVLTTDVGDDAQVEKMVTAVTSQHGRIDAVVHCAGVVAYGRTEEVPADVFEGVLRTNLTGSVNVARHAIPVLRQQGAGSLVLFGSVIGHISVPGMSPYVLSKWGVRALARQLQLENRDLADVTIAYIAPGGVDTPIYEQAANYDGFAGRPPPPVLSPERVARIALRRLDRHRARTQIGIANDVMRFGFNALPWAFDFLVGPLFRTMASDRTTRVAPTEGNVLESNFSGNQMHGAQGNALIGIGRNVLAKVSGKDSALPVRTTPSSSGPVPTGSSRPTTSRTPDGRSSCSRRSPRSGERCGAPRTCTRASCTTRSARSTRWRRRPRRSGRSTSSSTA